MRPLSALCTTIVQQASVNLTLHVFRKVLRPFMTSILVTNDDGVQAPGILALAQAMRDLGDVSVFARAQKDSVSGYCDPTGHAG
jgi:hypothetical protein